MFCRATTAAGVMNISPYFPPCKYGEIMHHSGKYCGAKKCGIMWKMSECYVRETVVIVGNLYVNLNQILMVENPRNVIPNTLLHPRQDAGFTQPFDKTYRSWCSHSQHQKEKVAIYFTPTRNYFNGVLRVVRVSSLAAFCLVSLGCSR